MPDSLTRRELLAAFLGLPAALAAGCGGDDLPPEGEIVGASHTVGHRIRDGHRPQPSDDAWQTTGVVIVGGGVAGLSAARRLIQAGRRDFVLLELESQPGGTSRSGSTGNIPHPWGAHYLPTPMKHNEPLIALLDEMGALEGRDAEGEPIVAEQFLCRDPEQRVFFEGEWHEDLYPHYGATKADKAERARLKSLLDDWVQWRDGKGRRAFGVPVAELSDDPVVTELDRVSMRDWMRRKGFKSQRLYWMVDFSCRDDYGLTIDDTSAWAGLFYFASRIRKPKMKPQPLISWPEGNGRLVSHLYKAATKNVRLGMAVTEVIPQVRNGKPAADVIALNTRTGKAVGWHAEAVIFAAPQFLAPHVIRGFAEDFRRVKAAAAFEYGSWMVANLHLKDRPERNGFSQAWENVIYGSKSLGYIMATHQKGIDWGPTVLTYYYPLTDPDVNAGRRKLLSTGWEEWADVTLTDLETAHPDIRPMVQRLDVMRWGHCMIRPRPGFVWGPHRRVAHQPFRSVHFANTDLSGVALFEEAFYHGHRAAEELLAGVPPSGGPVRAQRPKDPQRAA
jgi:protoporphyrinogen oxidase